mgnify:CR=1 FL=1|jgi:hypothetical protein|tara:strand:+ start:1013 stop:1459 length:447 start_codon:yes stop_codon:yes gene_type:complete
MSLLITEAQRSVARAKKLVDNLQKRKNKNFKPNPDYNPTTELEKPKQIKAVNLGDREISYKMDLDALNGHYRKSAGTKKVPISQIHSSQKVVYSKGVKNKLEGEKSTPVAYYHPESDKYYLRDGHHQLMRRKLLGKKHMEIDVHHKDS